MLEAARYRACASRLEAARYRACASRLEAARYRACASRLEAARYRACGSRTTLRLLFDKTAFEGLELLPHRSVVNRGPNLGNHAADQRWIDGDFHPNLFSCGLLESGGELALFGWIQ